MAWIWVVLVVRNQVVFVCVVCFLCINNYFTYFWNTVFHLFVDLLWWIRQSFTSIDETRVELGVYSFYQSILNETTAIHVGVCDTFLSLLKHILLQQFGITAQCSLLLLCRIVWNVLISLIVISQGLCLTPTASFGFANLVLYNSHTCSGTFVSTLLCVLDNWDCYSNPPYPG